MTVQQERTSLYQNMFCGKGKTEASAFLAALTDNQITSVSRDKMKLEQTTRRLNSSRKELDKHDAPVVFPAAVVSVTKNKPKRKEGSERAIYNR